MKSKYKIALMVVAAGITIFGFVTGKFVFLFLWLPMGLWLFKKKKGSE